jgi:hypothetical protein
VIEELPVWFAVIASGLAAEDDIVVVPALKVPDIAALAKVLAPALNVPEFVILALFIAPAVIAPVKEEVPVLV